LGYTFLIQATNMTSCPGKCIRPGLAFGSDNCLYVSSDATGEVCQDNLICFPSAELMASNFEAFCPQI